MKDELKAQGKRLQDFEAKQITAWAFEWLDHHPELLERAAETVRKDTKLRTLAEREERQRKGNRP